MDKLHKIADKFAEALQGHRCSEFSEIPRVITDNYFINNDNSVSELLGICGLCQYCQYTDIGVYETLDLDMNEIEQANLYEMLQEFTALGIEAKFI